MLKFTASLLLASSLICAIAPPAKANWQFTSWGMSKSQLVNASPVPILPGDRCPGNFGKYDSQLASDWKAGDIDFIACYLFKGEGLAAVYLYAQDLNAVSVFRALVQNYGRAERDGRLAHLGIVTYYWDAPESFVAFSVVSLNNYPYIIRYIDLRNTPEATIGDGL